jgi:hypothetical protein
MESPNDLESARLGASKGPEEAGKNEERSQV